MTENASSSAPEAQRRPPVRAALAGLVVVVLAAIAGTQWLQHWAHDGLGARVAAVARPGDIQMLSSETCGYCTAARTWFEQQGVPFAECFIERDPACSARFAALGAPGTPVLLVRGQKQVGFDARAVAAALQAPRAQ
jgi:glutaredoxin